MATIIDNRKKSMRNIGELDIGTAFMFSNPYFCNGREQLFLLVGFENCHANVVSLSKGCLMTVDITTMVEPVDITITIE